MDSTGRLHPDRVGPGLAPGGTVEQLLVAYVAHSAHNIERNGLPYPATLDVCA
ncbi:hypothetical protein [Streptomyces sp. NPDC056361]|uniref:hypothetical protein n=1 Tax=Streptomyces sp. NPDC056361 TaxID=3345795 RepID=UPI0035DBB8BD